MRFDKNRDEICVRIMFSCMVAGLVLRCGLQILVLLGAEMKKMNRGGDGFCPVSIGIERPSCAELTPRKSTLLSVRPRIGVGTRAEYYPWPGGENRR